MCSNSEGEGEVIEAIADTIRAVKRRAALDYSSDQNHNRTFTFIGNLKA